MATYRTQREQIEHAHSAYIMPLGTPKSTSLTERFALYLMDDSNELAVLWPGEMDLYDEQGEDRKKPNLLPYQCYHKGRSDASDNLPAFHFKLSGWGFSKAYEIKQC